MKIPFHEPYLDEQEEKYILKVLKFKSLGAGPFVKTFERSFQKYIGASEAIAVNSGTAALHLSVEALDIGEGDEVITTALTFCATIFAILYTGAKPIFADINTSDFCIDPSSIKNKITKKTKAVLIVHYAGVSCDMERIIQICKEYNLALIEDAAHALPTKWKGNFIGRDNLDVKNLVCFSFQATKNLSIGDGGMVTTAHTELADKIREKRFFGMSRNEYNHEVDITMQYSVGTLGYKYNMTDMEAAIGLAQLEKIEKMQRLRENIALQYIDGLSNIDNIAFQKTSSDDIVSRYVLVARIKNNGNGFNRNNLISYLSEHEIKTTIHFIPVYRFPYFSRILGIINLPKLESIADELLSFPIYPSMKDEAVKYIIENVANFYRENS